MSGFQWKRARVVTQEGLNVLLRTGEDERHFFPAADPSWDEIVCASAVSRLERGGEVGRRSVLVYLKTDLDWEVRLNGGAAPMAGDRSKTR